MKTNDLENIPKVEDINISTVSRVRRSGNRYYFSLRDMDCHFWDLKSGDRVLVQITKVKRLLPGER